jgi:CRISPR-associated endoribonuclease Cas6
VPQKIRFHLEGPAPVDPFRHAKGLRALALHWIESVDPARSAAIHADHGLKPYALSPLSPAREDGRHSWFEISVLDDGLAPLFVEGARLAGPVVRLGPSQYALSGWEASLAAAWESLLAAPGQGVREWDFRLLTPTAHHAPGPYRKSLVLPSPESYYGSWLHRWNRYSPLGIDTSLLDLVEARVAVSACAGGTQAVRLDSGRVAIGFTGNVRFALLEPETVSLEVRLALTCLARFATFCGTGVDTMRGLGQTVYLGEGRSQ